MYRFLGIIFILNAQIGFTQTIHELDGKWAFTGLRTTVFRVVDERLFVAMLEFTDTANFNRFVRQLPVDSSIYTEANLSKRNDTLIIQAGFPLIDHDLRLLYSYKSPGTIWYTGDVFFDSSRTIVPNKNCSLTTPACVNHLYGQGELRTIMGLKTSEMFTRDDAFEFLLRLNERLKSRCNSCYSGFTDAYMNDVFIEMGFNPIVKRSAVRSVWYNTSGFAFFIKTKFANDQRLVKLSDFVFDHYLK